MSVGQSAGEALQLNRTLSWHVRNLLRWFRIATIALVAVALLGRSAVDADGATWLAISREVNGWGWNLAGWEAEAIASKVYAGLSQPVQHLTATEKADVVRAYMARSQQIGSLEGRINALSAESGGEITPEIAQTQATIDHLRGEQHLRRTAVEQIIEQQVGDQLAATGLSFGGAVLPPVLFTFSEPPRKLIVSPRNRIDTAYWAMLAPELPADERERIETDIYAGEDLSAYVTNIGGLGAFPTLVIDRGALDWTLSTVAHEWTHNYLSLYPLGLNYGQTADLTILNETVADIVGDEVGAAIVAQRYPELVPPPEDATEDVAAAAQESLAFDFAKEMRHTREITDLFLSLGRVDDAEEYMEIRRLLFVENGYNLRKLNQAYFAFHGNYGTGAAATSPIGPQLVRLRELSPDLRAFLETVRLFTSADDLDKALQARDHAAAAP